MGDTEMDMNNLHRGDFFRHPLLVFQTARFAAHFPDWRLDDRLWKELQMLPCEIMAQAEPEDVGAELRQALSGLVPSRFFRVLARGCCLDPWFSEVTDMIGAGGEGKAFRRMCARLDAAAGNGRAVWEAFCASIDDSTGCREGDRAAERLGWRYRMNNFSELYA